jgi:hypothetical protein
MWSPRAGYTLLDVHGAGAQRSDPKSGDAADFPNGRGPQGDVIRIDNYVRLVRDAESDGEPADPDPGTPAPGTPDPGDPAEAPTIEDVSVRGTRWNPNFPHHDGYSISIGGAGTTASWIGIDQIQVTFSEDVTVNQDDLALYGVIIKDYVEAPRFGIESFDYDEATFTATWTLNRPLRPDKLLLELGRGIVDSDGNALDGRTSFRFGVLPGDADHSGAINHRDHRALREAMFAELGDDRYSAELDFDGSGKIDFHDARLLRAHRFARLPLADPVAPSSDMPGPDEAARPSLHDRALADGLRPLARRR